MIFEKDDLSQQLMTSERTAVKSQLFNNINNSKPKYITICPSCYNSNNYLKISISDLIPNKIYNIPLYH